MSELSPLQQQAARLLAFTKNPTFVRDELQLPQALFAQWREDSNFDAAVKAEEEAAEAEAEKEAFATAAAMFGGGVEAF